MMALKTADRSIPMAVLERTAAVLRVLAHPHRLKIIELISSRALTVGEVAEAIGIPPNACSQHLNIMKAHGVVRRRRDGKAIYYAVEDPNAINVLKCIRRHAS